jgi:PAS domain-containing protein
LPFPQSAVQQACCEQCRPDERVLKLPIDEYALLVPTQIVRSAVVIHGTASLACGNKIPLQVFQADDLLAGENQVTCMPESLMQLGLAEVFRPDPEAQIASIPLTWESSAEAHLLCKLGPKHSLDHVKTICNRQMDDLHKLVCAGRMLVSSYEWDIMKAVFFPTSPSIVTDPQMRLASANPMFCELTQRDHDQLIGLHLDDVVHLEREIGDEVARYPDQSEYTSPLYVRTLTAFFVSELLLSRFDTACGQRTLIVFRDLLTNQRTGNSNVHLIQKISAMIMSEDPPQKVLRRLCNLLTSVLDCDLVCILRMKQNDEMIVTPYVNRSLQTLRANIVERVKEPQLAPFFEKGAAVFCENVEDECTQESFFRRVLRISRFAFLPAGVGPHPEYALLMAWSRTKADFGSRVLPLLRTIANMMATVLVSSKRFFEMEQEKDMLRRHVRLTAGREVRMVEMKRENMRLKDMLLRLDEKEKV